MIYAYACMHETENTTSKNMITLKYVTKWKGHNNKKTLYLKMQLKPIFVHLPTPQSLCPPYSLPPSLTLSPSLSSLRDVGVDICACALEVREQPCLFPTVLSVFLFTSSRFSPLLICTCVRCRQKGLHSVVFCHTIVYKRVRLWLRYQNNSHSPIITVMGLHNWNSEILEKLQKQ